VRVLLGLHEGVYVALGVPPNCAKVSSIIPPRHLPC
jgi:hypothetical protein